MPSEKKHKKHKSENRTSTSNEPLKPLTHYVGDRLELTKHLFSCLKNKQIQQRLPANIKVRLLAINEIKCVQQAFSSVEQVDRESPADMS
jgi:Caspase activity and apoptosis inhibitor 1